MTVNGIEITMKTILATREHFAEIHESCIKDAITGVTRVNNVDEYIARETEAIDRVRAGNADYTLTFAQRALWIQTGECIPILGP